MTDKEKMQILMLKRRLHRGWRKRFQDYLKQRGYKLHPASIGNAISYKSVMEGNSVLVTEFVLFAKKDMEQEKEAKRIIHEMAPVDTNPDGSISGKRYRDMGDAADEAYERGRDNQ